MNHTRKIGRKGTLLIVVIIVLIGAVILFSKAKGESDSGKDVSEQNTEAVQETIAFPYVLEDGALEVEALFQYSGLNPDCKDEEGENVGAVQFKNCSERYLEEANLTIQMEDGTTLHFQIQNLPAGSSTMAFEVSNTPYDDKKAAVDVKAEVTYAEASIQEDTLAVSVEGENIEVKNVSQEQIQQTTVVYRCVMDDMYFGGKSFEKELSSLEAGESTSVSAEECYFGEAAVVNIKTTH